MQFVTLDIRQWTSGSLVIDVPAPHSRSPRLPALSRAKTLMSRAHLACRRLTRNRLTNSCRCTRVACTVRMFTSSGKSEAHPGLRLPVVHCAGTQRRTEIQQWLTQRSAVSLGLCAATPQLPAALANINLPRRAPHPREQPNNTPQRADSRSTMILVRLSSCRGLRAALSSSAAVSALREACSSPKQQVASSHARLQH